LCVNFTTIGPGKRELHSGKFQHYAVAGGLDLVYFRQKTGQNDTFWALAPKRYTLRKIFGEQKLTALASSIVR